MKRKNNDVHPNVILIHWYVNNIMQHCLEMWILTHCICNLCNKLCDTIFLLYFVKLFYVYWNLRNMRLKKNVCVLRNVFWNSLKKKKMLVIIFRRNEIKIIFLAQFWKRKKWCRLMVKALLLVSGKMVPYELDTLILWWKYNDTIIN